MGEIVKSELESFDYSFLGTPDGTTSGPITTSVTGSIGRFINGSNSYLSGPVANMIREKYANYSSAVENGRLLSIKLYETINKIVSDILAVFNTSKYDISSLDLDKKSDIETSLTELKKLVSSQQAYYDYRETVTMVGTRNGEEYQYDEIVYPHRTDELRRTIEENNENIKRIEDLLCVMAKLEKEVEKAKSAIEEIKQEIAKFKSEVDSITPSKETYFLANDSLFKTSIIGNTI